MLEFAGCQVIVLQAQTQLFSFSRLQLTVSQVKSSEIILFYYQMALLLETGISMIAALEILSEQATNKTMRKVLAGVAADIRGGSQLSVALSKYPRIFSPLHCQSLRVGERSGNLEQVLVEVSEHMEKELASARSIKNALIYPIFAVVVSIVVVAIMVTFVLPAFNKLYTSLNAELPPLTKMVIAVGDVLRQDGIFILLAVAGVVILTLLYVRTPKGRYNFDKLLLKIPLIGRLIQINELARLSRNISLLFRSGLSLTEIIPLTIQGSGNKIMAEALKGIHEGMIKGEGLSRPMAQNSIFLPMIVQMVRVGEETGNLDNTLLSVAKSFEAEAEDKTRSLIGMIQPAMMIIIGVVVGVLALSLVSAMYSMYNQM